MLIDQDPVSLKEVETGLTENTDFILTAVRSIEEASALLNKDSYDVVVTEQNLPDGDGLSFLKQIRSMEDPPSFIFLTSDHRMELVRDALNHGANYFLNKTGMMSELIPELSKAIRSCSEDKHHKTQMRKYQLVIDKMDAAFLLFRFDGLRKSENLRLLYMNPVASNIIGSNIAIGSSLMDLIKRPAIESAFEEARKQCLSTGKIKLDDMQLFDDNGVHKDYSIEVIRISNDHIGIIMQDVTVEKQALRNLAEKEEMFRLITENTGDNITLMDLNLNVSFTSSSIEKIRGFTAAEASKQEINDILTPDSLKKVMTLLQEQMALEKQGADPHRKMVVELEEYHKDGSVILVENTMTFYRDADMLPKGFITVSRDITEKRRNENELHHSYDLLEYIISHTHGGVAVHDRDLKYIYVSERYLKDYGLEGQDIIGRHHYEVFPDLPEKWRDVHRKALNGKVSRADEDLYYRDDGSVLWTRWECRPWYESDGRVGGFIVYTEMINEQIERELALNESRTQMEQIIENLPDATMVISKDGIVTHWNKSMEALSGVRSEDIVGQGDYAYSVPFYGDRRPILADVVRGAWTDYASTYDKLRNEGDILTVDASTVTSHGREIVVWANARPLYDTNGKIVGAIESIRDVTEIIQTTETLRRMNNQLGLMSHVARHDTLNQVMVIDGYLELMRGMIDDPGILRLFDRLELSAHKIKEYIEFTHIYHEIGSQEPVWQRLTDILPSTSDTPQVHFKTDVKGLEIYADAMIEKVFGNLFDNSLRHGGNVSEIILSYSQTSEGLMIVWEDNGKGVPPDLKKRIFERGYGTNTGLGLFLITEILNITDISIRENGEFGKGVRFEMLVPKENYRLVQPLQN